MDSAINVLTKCADVATGTTLHVVRVPSAAQPADFSNSHSNSRCDTQLNAAVRA